MTPAPTRTLDRAERMGSPGTLRASSREQEGELESSPETGEPTTDAELAQSALGNGAVVRSRPEAPPEFGAAEAQATGVRATDGRATIVEAAEGRPAEDPAAERRGAGSRTPGSEPSEFNGTVPNPTGPEAEKREAAEGEAEEREATEREAEAPAGPEAEVEEPAAPETEGPTAPPIGGEGGEPGEALTALSQTPPSRLGGQMAAAREESAQSFDGMREELADNPPSVERPSGLPREGEEAARPAPEVPERPAQPEEVRPGAEEQTPIDTEHVSSSAPLPNTGEPERSVDRVPEDDEEALARTAQSVLRQLGTRDPVDTDPGPPPSVDLTGEADPGQMTDQLAANRDTADAEWARAREQAEEDEGEHDIYPVVPEETLTAEFKTTPVQAESSELPPTSGSPEVLAAFDREAAEVWSEEIGDARTEEQRARQEKDADELREREETAQEMSRLEAEAAAEQRDAQLRAQEEAGAAREDWVAELAAADRTYTSESQSLREEYGGRIEDTKREADAGAREELAAAEREALEKRREAEAEAEAKREEGEEESGGFFGWARRRAKAFIQGIRDAVNAIFDGLRKAVKFLIEQAKRAAMWIIEQARRAIVGLIRAFGRALELAADVFLAAFPEARDRAKARIRAGVAAAEETVNRAAEVLKAGITALLDALGGALDAILAAYQAAFNLILDVVEFIVVGLLEILERIGHLVDAAGMMPDFFWGQVSEEMLGMDLSEPLPFERSEPPTVDGGAGPLSTHDRALLAQSTIGEGDVEVEPVAELDLDPEFFDSVMIEDGGEIEFGHTDAPENSLEALQAELLGGPAPDDTYEGEEGRSAEGEGPALSWQEEAEQRLTEMIEADPEVGCEKEKPAEGGEETVPGEAKFGPLTVGQRARFMLAQMRKGIAQWFRCNWPWLLAAFVGVILAGVLAFILTGGAITLALPYVLPVLAAVLIGVSLVRMGGYLGQYFGKGWLGDLTESAKSLARAVAIGASELLFALITYLTAGLFRAVVATAKAAARVGAQSARAVARTATSGAKAVAGAARTTGRRAAQAGQATVRSGKIVFQGVRRGFARGVRNLRELGERLARRFRFRKFKLVRRGHRLRLFGFINPWVLVADGSIEEVRDISGGARFGEKVSVPGRRLDGIVVGRKSRTNVDGKWVEYRSNLVSELEELSTAARIRLHRELRDKPAHEVRRILDASGETGRHAKQLRRNLEKHASPQPGDHAHHLVPSTHPRAAEARRILQRHGIGKNDAVNGTFVSEALHAPLHTHKYMDRVTNLLRGATNAKEVRRVLRKIQKEVVAGTFV